MMVNRLKFIDEFLIYVTFLTKNIFFLFQRTLSTTSTLGEGSESWLSKLLVRRIEPTKEPHSRMLSDKEVIYALNTHNVRPDCVDKYLVN